jgi:NADP-reducing hydrogenase subunit HndB
MDRIHSIKDLEAAKADALDRKTASATECQYQIRISMGSCGIAAGANETLEAINQFIRENNLEGVQTKIIGCVGLCALEPVIQVVELGGQPVTYGKVIPDVVKRIFNEHIEKRLIVQEYVVDHI